MTTLLYVRYSVKLRKYLDLGRCDALVVVMGWILTEENVPRFQGFPSIDTLYPHTPGQQREPNGEVLRSQFSDD